MKRWLLAGLLGLAILIFLSPGIIGLLAERSLERQFEQADRGAAPHAVRQLDFARGWFYSEGRHRVPIGDPGLARFLALLTPGGGHPKDAPALIIDTRLEHGLVPPGGVLRDPGALLPALATGVSSLALELPDGTVLPVPGSLYSRVGLTGSATFRYELPAGDQTRDQLRLTWQNSTVNFSSNHDGSELALEAELGGALLVNPMQYVEFSMARVAGNSHMTEFGYPTGSASLRIEKGEWTTLGIPERWDLLDVTADSAIDGDAVHGTLHLRLRGLETAEGPYDVELAASGIAIGGAELGPIVRGLQYGEPAALPVSDEPYPGFDADVRRLLSAGATLTVEELQLRTPAGNGRANVTMTVPALDEVASWPGLALAVTAQADIEIARTRVEAPSGLSDQFRLLIAAGVLVLDGDVYRLRAEFMNGKAIVNGAPLVLRPEWFR